MFTSRHTFHVHAPSSCLFPRTTTNQHDAHGRMGLLSWTASTAAKQAALMALLLSIPGLWWTYSGLTEADLEDPAKLASAHVLISLGFAWFIAGVAYKVGQMSR